MLLILSLTLVQIRRSIYFHVLSPFLDSHLGACRIKDKAGEVALGYVPEEDTETRNAFRRHQVQNSSIGFSKDDVADGMCFLTLRSIPGLICHRR